MVETAALARTLGDPTRMRILDALTAGPRRTSELAAATGLTPAALSRHLNQLREAQVVARRDVADDGRGRAYELRPAALEALAGWLRSTGWAAELAAVSDQPRTRTLLARMGGFLDAFAAGDVTFFQRHLRRDAVLVFPGMTGPVDKQGCLDSVETHPPYRRHRILTEPVVRLVGATTTVLTVTAEVATAADDAAVPTVMTAVLEEGTPWQLVHLQWTPTTPKHERNIPDD
ncbi:ArsR/SmtB family transcription factor [Saccharomonospora halophila]|uniref:ArsR/SmtB family transcription factor n=1 Tax=Saccharomonospora halophila TaxID=129922 RepID=UPI000A0636AB|nr:metalloregulator ArsR/SmtB family transcription factor [Saccharomonospora halophila]